ncbi:hypothetical protein J132_01336 [Termitomyces sp. J132]|nr:hypothetical protein J132_01336 [Termitomyces sp. J132]
MGWTNSVPIFHNNITFILQPEIPHNMLSFIDNIGAKGPKDWKIVNRKPTKHPTNPNICLVLWEFFELLNRVLQQMKYCSGTFSGHKLVLCTPTFKILEWVTVCKQMGCSPYFATTGTHPLLPANIVEATYLQLLPNSLLSTTDLIACRAIDLQHYQEDLDHLHSHILSACCLAAICFETEHAATICDYNFKTGNLVLMRNTRIKVTHNKKMKPHYLGPLVVISHNCGGTYIICELDGSVLHCSIAAFRLVPYFARKHITVPSDAFDIDTSQLRELEQTELVNNNNTGNVISEENYLLLSLSNLS